MTDFECLHHLVCKSISEKGFCAGPRCKHLLPPQPTGLREATKLALQQLEKDCVNKYSHCKYCDSGTVNFGNHYDSCIIFKLKAALTAAEINTKKEAQ